MERIEGRMKTRDELAEMFAVARLSGGMDPHENRWFAETMYGLADAFIAERERRAAKIENRVGRGADGATLHLTRAQVDNVALALGYDGTALPIGPVLDKIIEFASRDRRATTLPDETVDALAPEALRFVGEGRDRYLAQGDRILDAWHQDRFGAGIYPATDGGRVVEVKFRATDADHAERIVAAVLPVGRGTL